MSTHFETCLRFSGYDFEKDVNFISGLEWMKKQQTGALGKDWLLKAKIFFYNKFVEPLDVDDYLRWSQEHVAETKREPSKNGSSMNSEEDNSSLSVTASATLTAHSLQHENDISSTIEEVQNTQISVNQVASSTDALINNSLTKLGPCSDSSVTEGPCSDRSVTEGPCSDRSVTEGPRSDSSVTEGPCSGSSVTEATTTLTEKIDTLAISEGTEVADEQQKFSVDAPAQPSTDVPEGLSADVPAQLSTNVLEGLSADVPTQLSTDVPAHLTTDATEGISADVPAQLSTDVPENNLTFSEIMEYIEKGEPIPGLTELNIEPTNSLPTESTAVRKKKPWDIGVNV